MAAIWGLAACAASPVSTQGNLAAPPVQDAAIKADETAPEAPDRAVSDVVWSAHDAAITLDSHLDTPMLLELPGFDITERHDPLRDYSQVDLPRMIEGGLDGGFWVIYTPQGPLSETGYKAARNAALMRAVAIQRMLAAYPEHFELALSPQDAERIEEAGKRIVFQSIENSYPLGEDLSLLDTFYALGVRMLGPVHFANNQFADSATDIKGATWDGLSPLGEELVRKANRMGIILDASHASDATFDDMIELSGAPIILSHSGAKAVFDHPRNIDDARLIQLAEAGGVIQMNALGAYLKALQQEPARQEAYRELFQSFANISSMTEEEYTALLEKRREIDARFPADMADFEDYMDHFLHVLDLIGPEHVGVGADWDGGGGVVGMRDIAAFPMLTERLLSEGYSSDEIELIWGGNLLRVLGEVQAYAAELAVAEAAEDIDSEAGDAD
ncbi:MAG: dipeptidase [Hyphomonadaceae bacterium]|nr:dipeptidase [Hyphomonadaceae bacterium]